MAFTNQIGRSPMKIVFPLSALCCFLLGIPAGATDDRAAAGARYPTSDEAFYVLSCMEMNGKNAEGLRKVLVRDQALSRRPLGVFECALQRGSGPRPPGKTQHVQMKSTE